MAGVEPLTKDSGSSPLTSYLTMATGVVVRVVDEEEFGAVVLIRQVPIHPRVDDGGKRSGVMLVGLLGIRRKAGEGG